jgi:Arc/MetJ-type ribon-helix-helix transcriptional regulator
MQEKIDQIAEMSEVMRKAIELDERSANEYEERLKALELENKGLKELLKIKTTYGLKTDQDEDLK